MTKIKKYANMADEKIKEIIASWDNDKLEQQKYCFSRDLKKLDFPFKRKKADGTTIWVTKDYVAKIINFINAEIANRNGETAQETDVPTPVVEIPIPTMANETAPDTSNAGEKNVNKNLPKNSKKTIDKPKKINYIKNINETKTTNKEVKTMNKNEITSLTNTIKIAPNAVKKIMVAQKKNKTDIDARYWGGWGKVMRGMNAAYADYDKFQNLETEWLELRSRLGGMKSSKYHFCWGLINKNRIGVKQEPNATLRFIKNVKIRIAMANNVLANKYTKSQIDAYMAGLSQNYKIKYGLV